MPVHDHDESQETPPSLPPRVTSILNPAPAGDPAARRPGGKDLSFYGECVVPRPPGFLKQVMAEYPEWAHDQGVESKVLVWVTIDAAGRVTEAVVKRGTAPRCRAGSW